MAAEVRLFEPADEERVLQIFKKGFQGAIEGSYLWHLEKDFFESKIAPKGDMHSIDKFYNQHPDRAFFVAELDGVVCGICAAVLNEDGQSVELQRMSVSTECRGKGVGGQLVQAVVDFAVARTVPKVRLETIDRKVDAIRMYERHGFRRVNQFALSQQMYKEKFGIITDEVVHVIEFELCV